ncbi:hypothetical protein [Cupriavidus necator]
MKSLQKHGINRASVNPAILFEVYKNLVAVDQRMSIDGPLEKVQPKLALPKNSFPGDSARLAYM